MMLVTNLFITKSSIKDKRISVKKSPMTKLAASIIRLNHSKSVAHFFNTLYLFATINFLLPIKNTFTLYMHFSMYMHIKKMYFFHPAVLSKTCGQGIYTHLMEGSENKDGQLIRVPFCSHGYYLMAVMVIFTKLQLNQLSLASDLD